MARSGKRIAARWGGGRGSMQVFGTISPSPRELRALLRTSGKNFLDWRPAWRRLAPRMARGIANVIASRGALVRASWDPLSPGYARRKAREGHTSAELVLSGKMVGQVTSATAGVMQMTKSRLRFGVRSPQAAAMNFGFKSEGKARVIGKSSRSGGARLTGKVQGKTGARPFIFSAKYGVSKEIKSAAQEEVERHAKWIVADVKSRLARASSTSEVLI